MSDRKLVFKIRNALVNVSKKLSKTPREVTRSQLISNSNVTDWELRKVSIEDVKKLYFPETERDLLVKQEAKQTASYIKKLENELSEQRLLEEQLRTAIDRHIRPISVTPYSPLMRPKYKGKRVICAMLNDVHYGLNVDPEEVGFANEFNWAIAARRTALFIREVVDYKRYKRDETERVNLIVNGDLIAGVIHGLTGRDLELLVHQMNGSIHILVHAIKLLAENFRSVDVHFEVGNHGDMPHRREGGRVSSQTKDNFEAAILYAVSAAFRNAKSVNFHTQKGIYGSIDLPAGRMIYTHGHLLFSKEMGNPGTQLKTKVLSDAVMRFNNGEREKGLQPAKLVLTGHTHAHAYFTTPDGVQIYNVPSLSGVDSYAASLGINHNLVAQLVFESTEKYIFGDSRLIHLQSADKNKELDELIPPYDRELVWRK